MTQTPSNELDELDHLCNLCACLPPHDSAYSSKAQKEAILAWHQKKLDEADRKTLETIAALINSEVAKALERLEQFIEAESGKSGRKEIIAAIQDLKEEYKPMTNYNKGVCADCGEHCEMAARINKSSGSSPETGGFIIAEDEFDAYISYPFPLSSGKTARLYLPPSITRKDVARIIKMVEALTFEETPLRSNGERRQTNDQL